MATRKRNLQEDEIQEPNKKMKPNDRISSLCNDVLSSIISLLPPSEAARTVALSKRWISVWESVLETIVRLSIVSTTPERSPYSLVKDLKIELNNSEILNDQMVASALSNFPVLREFRLIGSLSVRDLTISCKKLKKLEISSCSKLESFSLFTPELVSFKYHGPAGVEYDFHDVPKLVEFSMLESFFYDLVNDNFKKIRPILEQLVKLNFGLVSPWQYRYDVYSGLFPEVKELQLEANIWKPKRKNILFFFYDLLRMAPEAEKVSLRLFWYPDDEDLDTSISAKDFNPNWEGSSFHKVRVFELDGFRGVRFSDFRLELEVVKVLLQAAANKSLEKVVVRVARRASIGQDKDFMTDTDRDDAIARAWKYIKPALDQNTRFA